MYMLWLVVGVLLIAVTIVFWMLIQKQQHQHSDDHVLVHLEDKVDALEIQLQKTLGLVQGLAKTMHAQQDLLDLTSAKLKQVENQNVELVELLAKVLNPNK